MSAYYNEIDPYAAQWLRNLIAAGHIAPGDVDERSIMHVRSDDLRPYSACHFFAGIGGWAYALRLAGWDAEREVWTGSCPCQPLSVAGQRQGHADQRHLWPAFYRLIAECRPATVFGEQVASKDGREWLAAVRADLEATGYAVGAADLCAAGIGAPHIRQRLWWVANADGGRREGSGWSGIKDEWQADDAASRGEASELADAVQSTSQRRPGSLPRTQAARRGARLPDGGVADRLTNGGEAIVVGNTRQPRRQGSQPQVTGRAARQEGRSVSEPSGAPWSDLVWLSCADGKSRPTQSGIFPLAHGVSARVGKLRAAGNAIVAPLAAEFIKASSSVT